MSLGWKKKNKKNMFFKKPTKNKNNKITKTLNKI